MALQVTITGDLTIAHGQQTVLTASVIDTDTGLPPTETVGYAWAATGGSFVGAIDQASATFLAAIAGNDATTVEITCEVSLPSVPASVTSATVTSMADLGIDDIVANIYFIKIGTGEPLSFLQAPIAGSDTELLPGLNLNRIRWNNGNGQFIMNRSGTSTVNQSVFWEDQGGGDNYAIYVIADDGEVFQIPPSWFDDAGGGYVRWVVPSGTNRLSFNNFLNGIANQLNMVVGIGTPDSIDTTGESATGSATANITPNQAPVVAVTAPARVTPSEQVTVSASVTEPEGETTTGVWSGPGTFVDVNAESTMWTAPATPGDYVLTFTATDTDGQVGSNTAMATVNSPPTVTLTVPSTALAGATIDVSAAVSDPNNDTVTVAWTAPDGSFGDASAASTTWTAPATAGNYTLTLTATDQYNAQTIATTMVTVSVNAAPTITITAPATATRGQVVNVSATADDADNDNIELEWSAPEGTFGDDEAALTTYELPNMPGTFRVTCTATDEHGASASAFADIVIANNAPTLSITVPSGVVDTDETITVSASASDADNDAITIRWTDNGGSFANDSAISTVWTPPLTAGTYRLTCTATDAYGATATASNMVTVNKVPSLSLNVPSSVIIGGTAPVAATITDPGDTHTTLWTADGGTFDDDSALSTTWNAPSIAGTYRLTCTVTDSDGATVAVTADVTVDANAPPTVTVTAPANLNPGQAGAVSVQVTDPGGRIWTVRWSSPAGSFATPTAESTTWTAPGRVGVYPVRCTATDGLGSTASKTAYITVGDPKANIYTPAVRIEIEGVDVTDRWIRRDGMIVGKQLDYPNTSRFRSSEIRFNVDNEDGYFDYSNPNNFFLANGLPAHGRGAKVLIRLGLSASELAPVFGGIVSELVTSLGDTKAQITLHDLSQKLSRTDVKSFGEEITRRITDFDGVNGDYDDLDPVFYFPWWGLPIARNSVSLVVHPEDGTDIDINIVDTIATSGMLSNTRAEVDYNRGLIRFEAPPTDGADTEITATWKVDYKYKRPDFLIRQLLKHSGIQTELGITDEKAARFGIEQALVSHPSNESFSSHGRPYPEENGVVRWLRRNGTTWQMIQDQRYIEYDEGQDEYTKVSEVPEESGLEGIVAADYGAYLPDESFIVPYRGDIRPGSYALSTLLGVGATSTRLYFLSSNSTTQGSANLRNKVYLSASLRDGTALLSERRVLDITTSEVGGRAGLSIYDHHAYVGYIRSGEFRMRVYNLATGNRATGREFSVSYSGSYTVTSIDVKAGGIYAILTRSRPNGTFLKFFSLEGVEDTSQSYRTSSSGSRDDETQVASNDNHLFVIRKEDIRAFTPSGVRDSDSDITYATEYTGQSSETTYATEVTPTRLYIYSEGIEGGRYQGNLWAYDLGIPVDFGGYVPYQFDSADNDKIFFLCANNTQGNAVSQSTLRKVKVYKYVKSTNTWTAPLNETTGQPQLSHAYKVGGEVTYLADNRKNFQAVRHNNETLVFYRRVRATASGVAYYNDNDSTVTDVYSENHSGSEDYGLPYSMDFALDIRSDGIYVYTFVVRYTFESDGDYNGGTLKVYRKRVEPNGTQTEIYSETFTKSSAEEDYPVSVSDLILADNRSKFYFVLDFHGEGMRAGRSELCTIAKSGSGSRTVIKTYDNPLVGARSPVERNGSYFYLEGGWVRQSKDDPLDETIPDDQHHYPNQGGTLIEIASDDSITDHGQVWRSATKQDSPDPENEDGVYDGWGLHNAVLSNMIVDDRGNLHFVAGYGSPYNIRENLPFSSNREPVPALSNYHWLQWGKDLSTKIASFPTTDVKAWALIEQLAQLMGWEIGFGPGVRKVNAIQAAHSSISDWGANASFFFRPRTILPAHLRTAISASGTLSTLALNDMGLPAEASEFPVPQAGERYSVIIDKELFTYTGVTPDSQGRRLTGLRRAQNGSVAAGHSVDAAVYFVDYFASGELGTTLVSIQNKSVDFVNLRNDVNVNYGEAVYPTKNQRSIDENGEFTFDLQNSLLSKYDQAWAELIGDTYLDELSDLKELLQATLVFSPSLQPGQLLVVYQLDRVRIEFKLFRLLQAQHHTHPRWQTGVTVLEIV